MCIRDRYDDPPVPRLEKADRCGAGSFAPQRRPVATSHFLLDDLRIGAVYGRGKERALHMLPQPRSFTLHHRKHGAICTVDRSTEIDPRYLLSLIHI